MHRFFPWVFVSLLSFQILRAEAPLSAQESANSKSGAAETFTAKLNEWKQQLKALRELRAKFDKANPDELDGIRSEWKKLVAATDKLIPGLRDAGLAAYLAAPNEDRQLVRFLEKLMEDSIARDQFEASAALGQALIDNGAGLKVAFEGAAIAAFALHDFEKAEKYFAEAGNLGAPSDKMKSLIAAIPSYKELWKSEQEARKKDEQSNLPRVKIVTTKGEMIAELFENEAPETVGNFVSLIEKNFYTDLKFHRVLPAFMAQGGCPRGDGTAGPGYQIYCEVNKPEHRKHFRGTLSMAHAGPNTGGSQFFLTFLPTPHLNGQHTVFGRVIEGLDVLEKLQRIDPESADKPEPDRIVRMEVLRKRDHEYMPNKVQ